MHDATARNRRLLVGILAAIGCEVLFGLSYGFTKHATQVASGLALLGWRFLVAGLVMGLAVAVGLVRVNLKGKRLAPLLLVALFNPCLYIAAETFGIAHTTATESGVFLASIPVVSLIASTLVLKKQPTLVQVIGIIITLVGVLITVLAVGAASSLSLIGYGALIVAVVSYALYSVFVDKASAFSAVELTVVMLAVGAVVFIGLALVEAMVNGGVESLVMLPFTDLGFAATIVYQGVGCSILAFFLANVAIARLGVNRAASFIGISTVVSILAGVLVLAEPFSVVQLFGALVIVAGVYIANARSLLSSR